MNDDRTEQALRRALDDAARQVDVSTSRLPEPAPVRRAAPPRRPLLVAGVVAAVAMLVVAALVTFGPDDDGPSVQIGQAISGPITATNADVVVAMYHGATDTHLDAVRTFLDAEPGATAYVYVTADEAAAEISQIARCGGVAGNVGMLELGPQFRVLVPDEAARSAIAERLAGMPAVVQVATRSGPSIASSEAATTTAAPTTTEVPTTLAPTTVPATTVPAPTTMPATPTTEVVTSEAALASDATQRASTVDSLRGVVAADTVPGAEATPSTDATVSVSSEPATEQTSKEIPFALPPAPACSEQDSGRSVQAAPVQPTQPTATLPPAGEQPADPAAEEQAIREMWTITHTASDDDRFVGRLEDYDELRPLMTQAASGNENMTSRLGVRIFEVRFVSPTRAAVRFQYLFGSSADMVQVHYAVLIDGHWMVARESMCSQLVRGGVHCPEGP